jgi:hypothetical protein
MLGRERPYRSTDAPQAREPEAEDRRAADDTERPGPPSWSPAPSSLTS